MPRLPLPSAPDELLAQGWREVSHPEAAKMGHRMFENPLTGELVRFDEGRPGAAGFEGQDHWHRFDPDGAGDRDMYLDADGDPVARGSDASHIVPGTT